MTGDIIFDLLDGPTAVGVGDDATSASPEDSSFQRHRRRVDERVTEARPESRCRRRRCLRRYVANR
jgi:hypothetical protein